MTNLHVPVHKWLRVPPFGACDFEVLGGGKGEVKPPKCPTRHPRVGGFLTLFDIKSLLNNMSKLRKTLKHNETPVSHYNFLQYFCINPSLKTISKVRKKNNQ